MEDLQTSLQDRALTVSALPGKGRCLIAARDFYPGEVIISQEPYICVPNVSSVESRCDGCFKSSNLKKCSSCQVVWYCGSTCQKMEWTLHRLECQALSRLDKDRRKSVTPSIRLMVKLCIRRKLQIEKVIPTTVTDNYSLVDALVAHMSEIDEKQLVLYAQMANLVNLILQWPEMNLKEVAEIFSKLACNAHTICDSELRPLGTALYPVISIINHSCIPNSVLVFEGRTAVVRAVQYLPKGAEVSISYIETSGSTVTRQKALKEQYFFTCTCPRCMKMGQPDDIQESAVLEGYRCKDLGCNGFLLRDSDGKGFTCQQCGLVRDKEEIKDIASELKLVSKSLPSNTSGNSREVISTLKIIETLQMKLCHPYAISLMQTRDQLLKILMEMEDWKEALIYCRLTIPVYERAYLGSHPLLGLQYYTCGKIEWLLGKTEDAIKSFTKAADILRITHGTKTSFMKELFVKLEEARAEAAYKLSSKAILIRIVHITSASTSDGLAIGLEGQLRRTASPQVPIAASYRAVPFAIDGRHVHGDIESVHQAHIIEIHLGQGELGQSDGSFARSIALEDISACPGLACALPFLVKSASRSAPYPATPACRGREDPRLLWFQLKTSAVEALSWGHSRPYCLLAVVYYGEYSFGF